MLHADQENSATLASGWGFVYGIIKTQSQIVWTRLFDKGANYSFSVSRSVSLLFVLVSPNRFSTSIISLFVSHVMLFHFRLCVTLDSISSARFVFFDLFREPRPCTFDMHCAHVITSTSSSSSVHHFPSISYLYFLRCETLQCKVRPLHVSLLRCLLTILLGSDKSSRTLPVS